MRASPPLLPDSPSHPITTSSSRHLTPALLADLPPSPHLPAPLITAYEDRIDELTSQVTHLARECREKGRRVEEVEGQMTSLMEKCTRQLEGGPVEGEEGEVEMLREEVDLLKRRDVLKAEEWNAEHRRLEGVIAQQRHQLSLLSTTSSSHPTADLLHQVEVLQEKLSEHTNREESLQLELSVEKDEHQRTETDVKRAKAERDERVGEVEQVRRVLGSMERRLQEMEAREVEMTQQLMTAHTDKAQATNRRKSAPTKWRCGSSAVRR